MSSLTRSLESSEKDLIAAIITKVFEEMDVNRDGKIGLHEWRHCRLLDACSPGPSVAAAIAQRLGQLENDALLRRLVRDWDVADRRAAGLILREAVPDLGLDDALGNELLKAMDSIGADDLTYAEFCAHCLGLDFTLVELFLYDLSAYFPSQLPSTWGRHDANEGIWHTGVVAFSTEYYYLGSICRDLPGQTLFGPPTKRLRLGVTLQSEGQLAELIKALDSCFQPELYDCVEHNGIHFSDEVVRFLIGRPIPNTVRLLSERISKTPIADVLRPSLHKLLGRQEVASAIGSSELSHQGASGSLRFVARSGDVVLVEVPECSAPIVAHVSNDHGNGTCDLCWFDGDGHHHMSTCMRSLDLRPYMIPARLKKSIYEVALHALDVVNASTLPLIMESSCQLRADRGSLDTCPRGHPLGAMELSSCQSCSRHRVCHQCGEAIPHKDLRVACRACEYDLCRHCWRQRRRFITRQSPACSDPAHSTLGYLQCPLGHNLERLAGQVHGQRACSNCDLEFECLRVQRLTS